MLNSYSPTGNVLAELGITDARIEYSFADLDQSDYVDNYCRSKIYILICSHPSLKRLKCGRIFNAFSVTQVPTLAD